MVRKSYFLLPILRFYLLSFIFLFSSAAIGQNQYNTDSLKNRVKVLNDDTNKVNSLILLSNSLREATQYDSSLAIDNKAIALAEKLEYKKGKADALRIAGAIYRIKGIYSSALDADFNCYTLYKDLNDKKGVAATLGNIGLVYWNQKDYPKALDFSFKSLTLCKAMKDKNGIARSYGNLGIIYLEQDDFNQALYYDSCAMVMDKELGDKAGVASILGNMGNIYVNISNPAKALECDFKAMAIEREIGDKDGVTRNLGNAGTYYTIEKKYALAKIYLDSALVLSMEAGQKECIKDMYFWLYVMDTDTHDYKAALYNYAKYDHWNAELMNEANAKKYIQAEMNFDFQQKQATQKAEQDKKDAMVAAEKKKQSIEIVSISIGLILVVIFSILLLSRFRITQRQKRIIELQKADVERKNVIVEEKQKEILDSIHYAERIQKVLLASENLLNENLHNYFVLFKPKDIVSGDFYWAALKNNKFYLAVCDSTGHGVPGAFMSLLNTSFLNEAIIEKNITSPEKVFNHVRTRLIENISRDGQQDGMDGVLVSFDNIGKTIQYSAAYNAPLVVRNNEVKELNTDKIPVGKSPRDTESFTLHSFSLQKNDTIYLFTDGYADQFGGPQGKKFKYKQLQQLIMDNAQLTMEEQKKILESKFNAWKGSLEQVDDVLIIGIRV